MKAKQIHTIKWSEIKQKNIENIWWNIKNIIVAWIFSIISLGGCKNNVITLDRPQEYYTYESMDELLEGENIIEDKEDSSQTYHQYESINELLEKESIY